VAEPRHGAHGAPLLALLILGVAALGFSVELWWLLHTKISVAVLAWKHAELQLIGRFTGYYAALDANVARADPATVTGAAIWRLFTYVGQAVRWPAAGLLGALALLVLFRAPSRRFRRKLDLDTLPYAQSALHRYATAFVGRRQDMVAPRIEGGPRPSDVALHAPEWIRAHAWDPKRGYRADWARRELACQLGPPWTGVEHAAPHVRCLFAGFALHAARHREDAARFLGELAETLPRTKGDAIPELPGAVVAQADLILRDPALAGPCAEVAGWHAFQSTAMLGVLAYARKRAGVMAPAQFNWLKLVDRRLWYALHSLGMPNPYVEARGSRDHYAAECLIGEPIHAPSIDRAALGLHAEATGIEPSPPSSKEAPHAA